MSRTGLVRTSRRFASVCARPSRHAETKVIYGIRCDMRHKVKAVVAVDRNAMSRRRGCGGLHGGRLNGAVVMQAMHDYLARGVGCREQPAAGAIGAHEG